MNVYFALKVSHYTGRELWPSKIFKILGEIDRLCTIALPDGYPSKPRKQIISIHKTVSVVISIALTVLS